ncbi:MAG: magnesium chelatase, partial [bacterium]|nr:magnesium chelatase [bacterium]
LKIDVNYPTKNQEIDMYKKLNNNFDDIKLNRVLNKKEILEMQKLLEEIHVSDNIYEYVSDLIEATRNPNNY